MLDRLKRIRKDPFSLFGKSQGNQGRRVNYSGNTQSKMIERFGEKLPIFLEILDNSLRNIEIGIISFVATKEDPPSRFTPAKRQKPAKVVINISKFPLPDSPGFFQEIEKIIQKVGLKKTKIESAEVKVIEEIPKTPPPSSVEPLKDEEKVSPEPLLVELSKDLKVYLPDIRNLGISVYRDKKSPWIDLERENGKMLSIWQWRPGLSRVYIGRQEYKIEGDALIEVETDKEVQGFSLKKDKNGKIIDLTFIKGKGNKELDEFLTPTSSLKNKEE